MRDQALTAKLEKATAERATIVGQIRECEAKLTAKREEVDVWKSKDESLIREFNDLTGTSTLQVDLLKIFKRRIKRSRKHGEDSDRCVGARVGMYVCMYVCMYVVVEYFS